MGTEDSKCFLSLSLIKCKLILLKVSLSNLWNYTFVHPWVNDSICIVWDVVLCMFWVMYLTKNQPIFNMEVEASHTHIHWSNFVLHFRFTATKAFKLMLNEINDLAGQHEVIAENLSTAVVADLTTLVKSMKDDRRKVRCCLLSKVPLFISLKQTF